MSDEVAIEFQNVWKKFRKGERATSLRDLIPAAWRRLAARNRELTDQNDFWALKDVSFEVKKGEILGIIGPNGAGKSTILKILSGIMRQTQGEVRVKGRLSALIEVGAGFHEDLTGRENVYLNAAIMGLKKREIDAKFNEIVEFSGIGDFIDTPLKRYSSGMHVRLGFAVAAHLDPEILLVDEVLAVGDAAFQQKCLGRISSIVGQGRTVVLVSHNTGAVRSMCSRVVWLDKGQLCAVGPSEEVMEAYLRAVLPSFRQDLELSQAQRFQEQGTQLLIRSVELNATQPIRHGEPLVARIEYETFRPVQGVSFSIGFCTLDGVRLVTIDSDTVGPRRDLPSGKRAAIEMRLDRVSLQPAEYVLDVGCRSGTFHSLDLVKACGRVQVLPGAQTPSHMLHKVGGVRLEAEWDWRD